MQFENLFGLRNEVAIVTGGGAGIGRAISHLFAEAGASVAVGAALHNETANIVANKIKADGRAAFGVACDVTKEELVNLVNETIERFGKITILVITLAVGALNPSICLLMILYGPYKLNVFSTFRLSQLCIPYMEKIRYGSILNISSMAGENKNVNMTSYASSKAALNHLTRNMAFDLGPKGIRVNAIAPGAIKTHALEKVLTPEIEERMLKKTPLGRLANPEDISPAASWISGQILTVSGRGIQEID